MSDPLLVRATEWNDTKLKQQEADENECLIKAVPDTFPDLLQKADLASADNMETVEYSQDVANSASRISSQFVLKYMHKIIAGIAKAEPSEELDNHKQVVKQAFTNAEFWFLLQFHKDMQKQRHSDAPFGTRRNAPLTQRGWIILSFSTIS